MSHYSLVENEFIAKDSDSLFHSHKYFRLHTNVDGRYFEWLDGMRVVASIHLTPNESGNWRSPARGTYAGFYFTPDLRDEYLWEFLKAVEQRINSTLPLSLEILPAPIAHDPASISRQVYMLRANGYEISKCDLNYTLDVVDVQLESRMSHGNQKRLRKCKREGLLGERLELSELQEVYKVLYVNRIGKGRQLSMDIEQLKVMSRAFPDRMQLFGVLDGNNLAASAVCFRVTNSILYVFYWGDLPEYRQHSPVVILADTIYSYCKSEGISLLDAGTSTEDIEPNFGLMQFKQNLGFSESLKYRLKKSFVMP